ncbi:MAG TPA: uroporphyrinogen-III synthase [Bacteroidales bacterium]|nr:uroporphyrinogen-III synthase [Bacteroidales bacterium]
MTKNISPIIISTASVEGSISLLQQLVEHGMQVYTFPMIEVRPIAKSQYIQNAISSISTYQWIIFTSKFGVQYFFESLHKYTRAYELPSHIRIACVGQKTADVLVRYNHAATYVCPHNNGDDFSKELKQLFEQKSLRVLFPTGNLTQDIIPLRMPETVDVDKLIVYQTNKPLSFNTKILEIIVEKNYTYIVFTSPSTVVNFVDFFKDIVSIPELQVVSIGPVTTKKLQEFGFVSILQADEYNYAGIVQKIASHNTLY